MPILLSIENYVVVYKSCGTICNRILAYAGVLINIFIRYLQSCYLQIGQKGEKVGLRINPDKTKYMIINKIDEKWEQVKDI